MAPGVPQQSEADRVAPAGGSGAPARNRRWFLLVAVVVLTLSIGAVAVWRQTGTTTYPSTPVDETPSSSRAYRAFEPDSWWNTPLPATPPLDPAGDEILNYLQTAPESRGGFLTLAGAGDSPWGTPIYWAGSGDPTYDVRGIGPERPPELAHLRIPVSAEPASNNDDSMTVYDRQKGYVVALTDAHYHADDDAWTASGATVTYLDSNGLHVDTGRSDDERNTGTHRGNNGATMAASWDQVRSGAIRHVLKVAVGPELADRYVFPMVGSDGEYDGNDPAVPPEGLRLRIKPSVDLEALNLAPEALIIARALQQYGCYIGDSAGSTALKLEDTRSEGRGQLWHVSADALSVLPFTPAYWDVLAEGYDPSR